MTTNLTGYQLLEIHGCHLSTSFLVFLSADTPNRKCVTHTSLNTIFTNSFLCDKWLVIKLMVFFIKNTWHYYTINYKHNLL